MKHRKSDGIGRVVCAMASGMCMVASFATPMEWSVWWWLLAGVLLVAAVERS